MSPRTNTRNDNGTDEPAGAFGRDKAFGNRLDQAFAIGETFALLGGKLGDVIDTDIGEAQTAVMLVQRVEQDTGSPVGRPFACVTVASAIVEKIGRLQPDELPAIVELRTVVSKRWGRNALVLQYVGGGGDDPATELAREFGVNLRDPLAGRVAGQVDPATADNPL